MTHAIDNPPYLSIVVPVYGGAAALTELRARVDETMRQANLSYELILVDDRGQAHAWGVMSGLARQYPEVVAIRLGRNFGQHAATICGMSVAAGQWVVTMDDDLEHPPEAIPSLLAAGDQGKPLVYGVFKTRTHAGYRNLTSEMMRWTLKKAFPDLNENYTSFRAMRAEFAHRLASYGISKPYIDGMLSWMTADTAEVLVTHGEREFGESTYTLPRLISHATNIFVTFSKLPLRLASYGGAFLALLSFMYLAYVVYGRLTGAITDPGYASLMSVVLFACGIQLVILGVLGEYVSRLMGATYRKPVFVIDQLVRRQAVERDAG